MDTSVGDVCGAGARKPCGCRQLLCPAGHGLQRYVTPMDGFSCDGCAKSLPKGSVTEFCRTCDFDLCTDCVRTGRAALPRQSFATRQFVPALSAPVLEKPVGLSPILKQLLPSMVLPSGKFFWGNVVISNSSDNDSASVYGFRNGAQCDASRMGCPSCQACQSDKRAVKESDTQPCSCANKILASNPYVFSASPRKDEVPKPMPKPIHLPDRDPLSPEDGVPESFDASHVLIGGAQPGVESSEPSNAEVGVAKTEIEPAGEPARKKSASPPRPNPLLCNSNRSTSQSPRPPRNSPAISAWRSPKRSLEKRCRRTVSVPVHESVAVTITPKVASRPPPLQPLNGLMPHFPAQDLLSPSERENPRCPRRKSPTTHGSTDATEHCFAAEPLLPKSTSPSSGYDGNNAASTSGTSTADFVAAVVGSAPHEMSTCLKPASVSKETWSSQSESEQNAQFCSLLLAALADANANRVEEGTVASSTMLHDASIPLTAMGAFDSATATPLAAVAVPNLNDVTSSPGLALPVRATAACY
eukprot:TRINITY_DN61123_c0_g1_i1.p1 TRINITY_DN61123_c0_g1~~TRINITY_DN61123_c0_g1_i1.p1  ORF type:complete len:591 (-),score=42.05 TRINITY_DN61123_c0_g1_i1:132-1718(-)